MFKDMNYMCNNDDVFFNISKYYKLYYPFLIDGMEEALNRIIKAIDHREKIVVYGYYDVDSITSISLLLLVLKYLKADVEYFIPNEVKLDKRLSDRDVKNIQCLGTELVLTIGCKITKTDEVKLLEELGIDFIVFDYEKEYESLHNSILVNPNKKKSNYPFKDLSYSGIVYKLVQALSQYYKIKKFYKYIDLVAIGTIWNNNTFIGENKVIVENGMIQLNNTNNYGVKALIKLHEMKIINKDNICEIIHTITPKVNPVGKMDNARIVVELLTTNDECKAEQIAKYLYREDNSK